MIVRVLEEGQYEIDDANAEAVARLDAVLDEALRSGDEPTFAAALASVLDEVRSTGKLLDDATIVPSDLALPHPGATLAEVETLLADDAGAADSPR